MNCNAILMKILKDQPIKILFCNIIFIIIILYEAGQIL